MELQNLPNPASSPALTVAPVAPVDPFTLFPCHQDAWTRVETRKCFTPKKLKDGVELVDVDVHNNAIKKNFTSQDQIQDYLAQNGRTRPELRVISLSQGWSWDYLHVTEDILKAIIDAIDASPELLEMVSYFYKRNSAMEEAFSSAPVVKCNGDSVEIIYILKYVAYKSGRGDENPWRIRQTGVYQKYDLTNKQSTWIFVHPGRESLFQSRLQDLLTSSEGCDRIRKHPMLLHNCLFTMYLPQWRDAMAYQENQILALSTEVKGKGGATLHVDHGVLADVYFVESRCLAVRPIFLSISKILDALNSLNQSLLKKQAISESNCDSMTQTLDNHSRMLDAYANNNQFLHRLAARTAQLMTDTISHKNSEHTLDLTRSTVNDSTTVRTITIVTLIYLPSTFTATVLGMNSFFEMDSNRNLVVSPQFWIFVVFSVPLTAVTVLYWMLRKRANDKKRNSNKDSFV